MVVAQESLVIEASVDDQVTPALKKTEAEVKTFANEARRGFEVADRSATKFGASTDALTNKLRSVGKAALGIVAIDFGAKLFGFSGALDVVRKSSDALAESIRDLVTGQSGLKGLTYFDRMTASANEAAAALARVRKEQTEGIFLIGNRPVGLGAIESEGTPGQLARALEAITKAQRDFEAQVKASSGVRGYFRSLTGDAPSEQSIANAQQQRARQVLDEIKREIDASTRSGNAFNAMVTERVALRQRELQLMRDEQDVLDGLAENYTLFETKRAQAFKAAADAANARRADLGFRPGFAGTAAIGQSFLAAQQAARQAYLSSPEYAYSLKEMREASGSGGTGGVFGELLQGGFVKIGEGLKRMRVELAATAREAQTFGAGMRSGFEELREFTSPSALGNRFVIDSFQNFRGFFNDLANGAKSFKEAIRDLARNFVASLADMIAQMLAFRAVAWMFGSFFGAPAAAASTSFPANTGANAPGGFSGAGLLMSSGGGGGGNRTVNVTLNVGSLDPRNAAAVILENMPAINQAIQGAIVHGTSRGLRLAVGSV